MRVADMYMGFDMKLMPEDYEGYPEGSGGNADFDVSGNPENTIGEGSTGAAVRLDNTTTSAAEFRAEQPTGRRF